MLEVHSTYDKGRLEKLSGMFGNDPRQGNATLYVREHFNRKRICESCGTRTTAKRLAIASAIVEGPSWVLPISVSRDGQILIDLEESIPDQSNFLFDEIIEALGQLNIIYNNHGSIQYAIPILSDRNAYFGTLTTDVSGAYERVREELNSRVVTDAGADDVLAWDTEVEYDWERSIAAGGDHACGYNVEIQYFQWLAEHGRLIVSRVSDKHSVTLGVGYGVATDYELTFVNAKHKTRKQYETYSLDTSLVLMMLDYIYDNELTVPLGLGSALQPGDDVRWHPIPVAKPRLEFASRLARQTFVDCFSST